MSDQGFFQRTTNVEESSLEEVSGAANILSSADFVAARTASGPYTVVLPDQVANAGRLVGVFNVDGANVLTIAPLPGQAINGVVDATVTVPAAMFSGAPMLCTGFGWIRLP